MPEFKRGDRAVYTGKDVNWCFEDRIGKGLVVKGDPEEGFVKVRMDNMDHDINVSVKNIELIKEDKMDTVTLKKEDLQKAYAEGCSDVKRVLDKLYPGQTKRAGEWVDITSECTLDTGAHVWVMYQQFVLYHVIGGAWERAVCVPFEFRMKENRIEKKVS